MSSAQAARTVVDKDGDIVVAKTLVPGTTTEAVWMEQPPHTLEAKVIIPERHETIVESVGVHIPAGPVTIGGALEKAAANIGDKPLTVSDARAIQSAEAIATGVPSGVRGGPGALALSAVDSYRKESVTVADVIAHATTHLPHDKIVTPEDAATVHSAEARNNDGQVQKGGVTSSLQQAAAYNQNAGFIAGADGATRQ